MKVIVVTNRKGGVGKTTVATHLSSGLAMAGYRVALVDTDAQGHSAKMFGMPKENGLYSILCEEDVSFQDVLRVVPVERYVPAGFAGKPALFLLPSDKLTVRIPTDNQNPFAFRQMLEGMDQLLGLDFIVVDTGPTASMFDGSVNFAANYFLYVTEMAHLSFDGLAESVKEMKALNKQSGGYRSWDTQILGIVPNKTRYNTRVQRRSGEELSKYFPGMVWQSIMLATLWEECAKNGQMIFSLAPESREASQAQILVSQALSGIQAYGS
jgi:chromosome partitioning protein